MNTFLNPNSQSEDLRLAVRATVTIFAVRGVDLPSEAQQWAAQYLKTVGEAGAALELQELLHAGCKGLPLAAVLEIAGLLAGLPDDYLQEIGGIERGKHLSEKLLATAVLFDGLSNTAVAKVPRWPLESMMPSPQQMAAHLRTYAQALDMLPVVFKSWNIMNTHDIERHLTSAYVRHATGNWHDREVSALIQAATGTPLDEHAHRMWRNRNMAKIEINLQLVWEIAEMLTEAHHT